MQRSTRRRHPSTMIAAAALSAAALAPAIASAQGPATGIVTSSAANGMTYRASDASNNVRITLQGTTFTVDDIVAIQAGAGCAAIAGDATKVTCTAFKATPKKFKQFVVLAAAGNDTVVNDTASATTLGVPMLSFGGGGNDTLIGSAKATDELDGESGNDNVRDQGGGQDKLTGGTGDDDLLGGPGNETMNGGSGADDLDGRGGDDLLDGGTGPDVIDGGDDSFGDTVLYDSRVADVTVDLLHTAQHQGEAGEGDLIFRVENAMGGAGNDTLRGTTENNLLSGRGGDDHLDGREGQDRLTGGFGRDTLIPSQSPDGQADFLDCDELGLGDGNNGDLAFRFLADGDLVSDCEQVLDL